MKRCFDPKCSIVFPQLIQVLRKLLEKRFRGAKKDTFIYPGEPKNDSNNISLLSGCHGARHDLEECSTNMTGL